MGIAVRKHKQTMDGYNRYVEIFETGKGGRDHGNSLALRGRKGNWDGVLKLRGAPYSTTPEQINEFFEGLNIAPNGITIVLSDRGDCAGEAFVQFMDYSSAEKALTKDRQDLGGRYIELFRANNNERRRSVIENRRKECQFGPGSSDYSNGGLGNYAELINNMNMNKGNGMNSNNQGGNQMNNQMNMSMPSMSNTSSLNTMNSMMNMMMGRQNSVQMDSGFGNMNMAGMANMTGAAGPFNTSLPGGTGENATSGGPMKSTSITNARATSGAAPYQMNTVINSQNGQFGQTTATLNPQVSLTSTLDSNESSAAQPVTPPKTQQDKDCPFPHIVGINGVEKEIVNTHIQEFFKPVKAIAVNNHGNGYCDVAFKTHKDAEEAMSKDNNLLGTTTVTLILKSKPPAAQPTGWGLLNE